MLNMVDQASIREYRLNGAAVIHGLADAALVARLRTATNAALAAPGNLSGNRRRAYSTRWLGDDTRHAERPGESAFPSADIGLRHGKLYRGELFPLVYYSSSHED